MGDLHHMRARHHALKMVTPVGIGDGKAAIFHQHPDPAEARGSIAHVAIAQQHAADNRHPARDGITLNQHGSIGAAAAAQRVAGGGDADKLARLGIGADGGGIADPDAASAGQAVKRQRQPQPIGGKLHRAGRGHRTINPDRIAAHPHRAGQRDGYRDGAAFLRLRVADRQGVKQRITGLRARARHGVGKINRRAIAVNRQVNLDRLWPR